jgi:hypothetical protein
MRAARALLVLISLGLTCGVALCQSTPQMQPVPSSPYELANGPTLVVDTPQNPTSALEIFQRAQQNFEMRSAGSSPFTLRVSFVSSGSSSSGAGEMEEAWISPRNWRLSTRLGDYSQVQVLSNGRVFYENPSGPVPLRLRMVRDALLGPLGFRVRVALIRTVAANWNGTPVTCVLVSPPGSEPTTTPGRRWQETEYCIDPKTNLLQIHSIAPSMYVVYDYNDALQFHGRLLPRQITVAQGDSSVLQIHLESIADGGPANVSSIAPSPQMLAEDGQGLTLGPTRFPQFGGTAPAGYTGAAPHIIVHAILDEKGKAVDAEALQDSDAALAHAALDLVRSSTYAHPPEGRGHENWKSISSFPSAPAGILPLPDEFLLLQ